MSATTGTQQRRASKRYVPGDREYLPELHALFVEGKFLNATLKAHVSDMLVKTYQAAGYDDVRVVRYAPSSNRTRHIWGDPEPSNSMTGRKIRRCVHCQCAYQKKLATQHCPVIAGLVRGEPQ